MEELLCKRPLLKSAVRTTLLKEAQRAGVSRRAIEAYLAAEKPLHHELARRPKRAAPLIITAPPGCFQLDVMILKDYKSANAGRDRALAALHKRIVEEAPFLWVAHDVGPRAMSAKVTGVVQPRSWFIDIAPMDIR